MSDKIHGNSKEHSRYRIVMIKKVKVEQLKPGMYIDDLNCTWLKHPFFGNSLKVNNEKVIATIVSNGIKEVYIDTDLGLDVPDAPTKEEIDRKIDRKIKRIAEQKTDLVQPVSVYEEINHAKKLKNEAKKTVRKVMNDVMVGKKIEKDKIADLVDNITTSVIRNQDALIGLGKMRKVDEYLYNHSMSVCVLMTAFARQLGFDFEKIREISMGAMLHDIGTTKVPVGILHKTSALTDGEYAEIKEHVGYGRNILEETSGISDISILTACQHHERLNGSGYPNGLKGDEISVYGQAIAIVDVYDALTSRRCYKRKIAPTEALKILFEWEGDHFNGEFIQKFIRCIGVYPVGTLVRLESGLLGVVINHGEDSLLKPIVRIVYDTKRDSRIVIPYDIDLSRPGKHGEDRVTGYEQPEKFDILPEVYL